MTKSEKLIENPKQRKAFLIYFSLEKRSLENLRQHLTKNTPKKVVSLDTLKNWSRKFKWQERISTMDAEATRKLEEEAIKKVSLGKEEILTIIKTTMIKYHDSLLSGITLPSASDFEKVWKMKRVEEGIDTGEPESPIKVVINQRILAIVQKAEQDMREELRHEIIEDG